MGRPLGQLGNHIEGVRKGEWVPVVGPLTYAVWSLLEGVQVCRCLCGVSMIACLDPACLCLISFPLPPPAIDTRFRFEGRAFLIWALRPVMNDGGVVRLTLSEAVEACQGMSGL